MSSKTKTVKGPPCPTLETYQYWANWNISSYAPHVLRRDTRIYWEPQLLGTVGQCVGTFYGENPGSGTSIQGLNFSGYSPIWDDHYAPGDPTLRLILEIWRTAKHSKAQQPKGNDYIEVLNLYYFRNPESVQELEPWRNLCGALFYNPKVSSLSKFILLGWGSAMNSEPEAQAAIHNIGTHASIIIPSVSGSASSFRGPLTFPLPSSPTMPAFFHRTPSKKAIYIRNVARLI